MKDKLSMTQRFVLFALAKKPAIGVFHKDEMGVGLYVAGVMELLGAGVAVLDEKDRLLLEKPLPAALSHLAPLCDTLEALGPKKPAKGAQKYVGTFLNRNMDALSLSIIQSLEGAGQLTSEEKRGLFYDKTQYPVPSAVLEAQVERLRQVILSPAPLAEGDVVLAALLKHAGLLKQFFSKHEADRLKSRLAEVKNSDSSRMARKIQNQIDAIYAATAAAAAASAAR